MVPVSLSKLFRSLWDWKLLGDAETVSREMSEDVSKLVAEECRRHLMDKLGSISLALELPQLEAKGAVGAGYQVQYAKQTFASQVERDPKGGIENVWHLIDENKKFYKTVTNTEKIATGENFSTFLDAQVESLRPEVRRHVSKIIDHMASACINPLLDCYQQLDEQLEQLTVQLEALRFTDK